MTRGFSVSLRRRELLLGTLPLRFHIAPFRRLSTYSWAVRLSVVRHAVCALAFSGVLTSQAAPGSAPLLGTVVSAHGRWCDQSQPPCTPLWKMYTVHQDSKLIRRPPFNADDSVTIRSRWGSSVTFACADPRELGCKDPLDLSRLIVATPGGNNVITALFDAIAELAADHPKVYEAFREAILPVRGAGGLSDGVAQLTDQGLRLDRILQKVAGGNLLLELCPLNDREEANCPDPPSPVNYAWNAAKPLPYPAKDVHPGMYRLYECDDSTGAVRRTRESADVLMAEGSKFQMQSEEFQKMVDATKDWDASDSTAPALRRAYLYTLSRK